jgi:hypothetical protein
VSNRFRPEASLAKRPPGKLARPAEEQAGLPDHPATLETGAHQARSRQGARVTSRSGGLPAAFRCLVPFRAPGQRSDAGNPGPEGEGVELIQIRLDPGSHLLEATRSYLNSYMLTRFHSRTAEKVALASHELIENALNFGSVTSEILYSLTQTPELIEIRVSNSASSSRQQLLHGRMEKLVADAEKAYLEEMSRSVSGGLPRAQLGLARICHEAQMSLEAVIEGGRITMIARCQR